MSTVLLHYNYLFLILFVSVEIHGVGKTSTMLRQIWPLRFLLILVDFKQSIFPLSLSLWILMVFKQSIFPLSLSLWILVDFKQSISLSLFVDIDGFQTINLPSFSLFVDIDGIQAINLPSLSLFVDIGGFQTINLPLSLCGY